MTAAQQDLKVKRAAYMKEYTRDKGKVLVPGVFHRRLWRAYKLSPKDKTIGEFLVEIANEALKSYIRLHK